MTWEEKESAQEKKHTYVDSVGRVWRCASKRFGSCSHFSGGGVQAKTREGAAGSWKAFGKRRRRPGKAPPWWEGKSKEGSYRSETARTVAKGRATMANQKQSNAGGRKVHDANLRSNKTKWPLSKRQDSHEAMNGTQTL